MTSIISQLGYGSGLDTQTLVAQLTAAARAPKDKLIATREAANTASVSSLATVSNGIDAFSTSLKSLIAGGTLMTQPTASDDGLVGVRALTGARIGDLSAQLEVRQLAQAQSLSSAVVPSRTAGVGTGTLTLTVGTSVTPIRIGAANNSVAGLAAAINDARTGVTATVVDDAGGVRLVLKGGTGAARAFTLAAAADSDPVDGNGAPAPPAVALAGFAYDPGAAGGMTRAQEARDAIVRLDGVELSRATNSFSDAIPGVIVDLKKAAVGTTITIGTLRPSEAITAAVTDFVGAYNEMKGLIDAATKPADADGTGAGPLRGDAGLRDMQRRLARLTATALTGGGAGPRTLSEIGVVTNRDGTLTLNAATLAKTLAADPDGVEALFNPGQRSDSPFVTVTSAFGAARPGTYRLTDLVPPVGTTAVAAGKVDGAAMLGDYTSLVAPAGSAAAGLIIRTSAAVASATVTVDLGIGGALQSIRDALRGTSGPLSATSQRLGKAAVDTGTDRKKLEQRSATYNAQLTAQFTAMEKRVSAFKATQSYIEQQVALWTKSN